VPVPVLFCADPLNPRRVDDHFAAQADAVRAGGGTVGLIDHDALTRGDAEAAVRRVPRDLGPAWYRGWMIAADRYGDLASALAAKGGGLVVPPENYRRAHELPGWYGTFASLTPRSVWMASPSGVVPPATRLAELVAPLLDAPLNAPDRTRHSGVVKDFVKSRKHEWHEACFVPSLDRADELHAVVARMVELQEDSLAGGIVVRAFEDFDPDGEARVWWVDGEPVLVTPHPDTPDLSREPDLDGVGPLVRALGCRFVTTDLARRVDGTWRVVEVGDGQVSDLPGTVDPYPLMDRLSSRAAR
jgi:hypothetical protein